jgi:hypothetical protein
MAHVILPWKSNARAALRVEKWPVFVAAEAIRRAPTKILASGFKAVSSRRQRRRTEIERIAPYKRKASVSFTEALDESPAATYSPTHLRAQYHRR